MTSDNFQKYIKAKYSSIDLGFAKVFETQASYTHLVSASEPPQFDILVDDGINKSSGRQFSDF